MRRAWWCSPSPSLGDLQALGVPAGTFLVGAAWAGWIRLDLACGGPDLVMCGGGLQWTLLCGGA